MNSYHSNVPTITADRKEMDSLKGGGSSCLFTRSPNAIRVVNRSAEDRYILTFEFMNEKHRTMVHGCADG